MAFLGKSLFLVLLGPEVSSALVGRIGPTDLTEGMHGCHACGYIIDAVSIPGTVKGADANELVPTVTDTAYSDGNITSKMVGISFAPVSSNGQVNGELTFGYADSSKYTGDLNTM